MFNAYVVVTVICCNFKLVDRTTQKASSMRSAVTKIITLLDPTWSNCVYSNYSLIDTNALLIISLLRKLSRH